MRSTNDGGHIVRAAIGTVDDEMAALEQLGPMVRLAIYESPVRWSALAVLKNIEAAEETERRKYPEHIRHLVRLDPLNPELDKHMARGLLIESAKAIRKDRDEADALLGVKPIIPRQGTTRDLRVLRAERVAERRARRFYRCP
jgi:hypothetical protein